MGSSKGSGKAPLPAKSQATVPVVPLKGSTIDSTFRANYGSKRVLVVDDFQQHLNFMRKSLLTIGFKHVVLAQSPTEALQKCKHYDFDLVFSDYNMGEGKNGQQLIEEMRYRKLARKDCVFVLLTAETSRDIVLGAIDIGPEAYIAKPFSDAFLRRKIDQLMDRQKCLAKVNSAIEAQEFTKAVQWCAEIADNFPRHFSWCQKTLAELYHSCGQYTEAIQIYNEYMDQKRVSDWALLGIAKCQLALGNYVDVEETVQRVLAVNMNCVAAYDLMGKCCSFNNDSVQAQKNLEFAVNLSPHSIERQTALGDIATINGDHECSAKAYRAAVRLSRHSIFDLPENYCSLAGSITDSMAGDVSSEDDAKADDARGIIKEIGEKFEKARVIDFHTGLVDARIHVNQQDIRGANKLVRILEKDMDAQPLELDAGLGMEFIKTYLQVGDSAKALEILLKLQKDKGVDYRQRLALSVVKKKIDDFNTPMAMEINDKDSAPERSDEFNERGATLYEQGELDKAIAMFARAARINPDSVAINLNYAQAMIRYMETVEVVKAYMQDSLDCLETVAQGLTKDRHTARHNNLAGRLRALSTNQQLAG